MLAKPPLAITSFDSSREFTLLSDAPREIDRRNLRGFSAKKFIFTYQFFKKSNIIMNLKLIRNEQYSTVKYSLIHLFCDQNMLSSELIKYELTIRF